jgi:hypothetical protein
VVFPMEFVPKGEREGCEWREPGRESLLHPLQMGTGHAALAPKRQVFGLAWLVGRAACGQQRQPMYVLPGAASLNKLFVNTVCVLPCGVTKCSVTSHQVIPPTPAHPWD